MPEVFAEGLSFPEGPCFDAHGALWVVELRGKGVARITPDGVVTQRIETGGGPNGAAFGPDGHLYVCNVGVYRPDGQSGRIDRISPDGTVTVHADHTSGGDPLAAPNDLVFDAHGGFYFTDPVWGKTSLLDAPPGHVCYAPSDGRAPRRLHTGLVFPNGIGISPDGRTLVVAESGTNKLHACDIREPGVIGPLREFGDLGEGAVPDGLCFDADGYLLCCGWQSHNIHVFPPDGGPRAELIEFEDPEVTNVCFGGPDFQTLYVTESGKGRVVTTGWKRPGAVLFPDR